VARSAQACARSFRNTPKTLSDLVSGHNKNFITTLLDAAFPQKKEAATKGSLCFVLFTKPYFFANLRATEFMQ
jgi:hypothetical protein